MLKILLNTQHSLDIDSETSVQIEYENPLFVFDALPGAATYNFTIPATPNNNHIFEHANVVNSDTRNLGTYACQIYANDVPLLRGVLTVTAATKNRYTCNVVADFLDKLLDAYLDTSWKNDTTSTFTFTFNGVDYQIPLSDWELENIGSNTAQVYAHFAAANAGTYPDYTHCFPVFYSETFFDGAAQDPAIPDTWTTPYPHQFYNHITAGVQHIDQNTMVPWFYVVYILLNTLQRRQLSTITNIAADAEFCTLCMFNNYTLDSWVFYDNLQQQSIVIGRCLPHIPIKDFLLDLRRKFGIVFFFDLNAQSVAIWFQKDLAENPDAIDISQYVEPQYTLNFTEQIAPPTLCNTADEQDSYSSNFAKTLESFTIAGTVDKFPALPDPATIPPNELYYVATENCFAYVSFTEDPDNPGQSLYAWQRYTYNYFCTTDAGGQNIESSIPMLMYTTPRYEATNPNTTWVTPRIETYANTQELCVYLTPPPTGILHTFPFLNHNFGLRYAYYRGLQPDSQFAGYSYALATPTAYNAHGDRVGLTTLDFNGTDGIYAKFWQPFITKIANAKVVEKNLLPNALMLSQLDLSKKYAIQEATGITHYFIKKLTVTLTATGIEKSRVTLVQVI